LPKATRFLRSESATIQAVPDQRAKKTKEISDDSRITISVTAATASYGFHDVNWLDHVRLKNEVDDRLRPAKQNETRPENVPTAKQDDDDEPNLVGISHRCCSLRTLL
jgi:hypothetical protein